MSSAVWRQHITFNRYTQVAARAVRQSLKEGERVKAEKRGLTVLRYQNWENGLGGEQIYLNPEEGAKEQKKEGA